MDSYLIGMYRREKDNSENIVGIIEEISTKEKYAFKNLSELGKIICLGIKKTGVKNKRKALKKALAI